MFEKTRNEPGAQAGSWRLQCLLASRSRTSRHSEVGFHDVFFFLYIIFMGLYVVSQNYKGDLGVTKGYSRFRVWELGICVP